MDFDNPKVSGDTFISDGLVIFSIRFLRQHYLRETGATTKDDLSVVLGEFDLSSDSDTYDAKRQTLVEAQKRGRLIFSIMASKHCNFIFTIHSDDTHTMTTPF